MTTMIERVELADEATDQQMVIAQLLSEGNNYYAIAELFQISARTVKFHAQRLAAKIPGDLPTQWRIVAWYRGATLEVLGADDVLYSSQTDPETPAEDEHDGR